ncbi:MAG TPA: NPCBM/NEW2 domain-containing protein [Verrucomicrobiae bacterium]|nr:NPCBM/NEW2 domain-containing protein [Verrucomicrobiae bacterium]
MVDLPAGPVAASRREGSAPVGSSLGRSVVLLMCLGLCVPDLRAADIDFLSDRAAGVSFTHQQQWGDFGLDTAAARPGAVGSPLRIGDRFFAKGLGHHANGEIVVDLRGRYETFRAWVGVQWQGGKRGSAVFRIAADGETVFETRPMSDSDAARRVEVPLRGVRELRLIASDGGDGISCDMANWAEAELVRDARGSVFGTCVVTLDGEEALPSRAAAGGLSLIGRAEGPQMLMMAPAKRFAVSVRRDEEVRLAIPVKNLVELLSAMAEVSVVRGTRADVALSLGTNRVKRRLAVGESAVLSTERSAVGEGGRLVISIRGIDKETGVRLGGLRCARADEVSDIPLLLPAATETLPPPLLSNLRPSIEREVIEWDWRMQDGIGTPREPRNWSQAIDLLFRRGDRLIDNLSRAGARPTDLVGPWEGLRRRYQDLISAGVVDSKIQAPNRRSLPAGESNRAQARSYVSFSPQVVPAAAGMAAESEWETLWRSAHEVRRKIAFCNPLAKVGPLAFVKNVPSAFSHQLTQYSGRCARPGGGVFVLGAPGDSMRARRLDSLPTGSFQHLDVSWDGRRVLFAFCKTNPAGGDWRTDTTQFYHLFEMASDGSGLRQLTDGPHDDFSPRQLPGGKVVFLSTRRGGYHRCGRGPCPVYTMAVANADGSDPRVISFHETHEWDPAVLNDGRIIYTRWDYVDRNAVHYQQLWTARPDGSGARAFYGNNTLNPVGIWEARPIPNSHRVMATAAAHHAMTAGSIILLDTTRGVDGLEPISRLTRDALFPESESPVQRWHAKAGITQAPEVSPEEKRWPGHCYRTPFPLSEDYFLAAYSFESLVGEPNANRPNMFGIYLVDRFGNKELIYRDVSIGSLWPMPLRARPRPPAILSTLAEAGDKEGTFFMQDVDDSWPQLAEERGTIKELRILQVLPKTTPHANEPRVGLANASPGKQVLGTVPVEADGSAYFRAPAGVPLAFQALDGRGMAVQTMRSVTYLQPGERASCIGCHEQRVTAPVAAGATLAGRREPSVIEPGPEGSRPFNYAILVQPILDKHCVRCHCPEDAKGGINLSGAPSGEFTASYLALAPRVRYSEWKATPQANSEPLTHPDLFGARSSPLMTLLLRGHEKVVLTDAELRRLATWMDANALFYGTFDPEDQQRQRRGDLIAGPALE